MKTFSEALEAFVAQFINEDLHIPGAAELNSLLKRITPDNTTISHDGLTLYCGDDYINFDRQLFFGVNVKAIVIEPYGFCYPLEIEYENALNVLIAAATNENRFYQSGPLKTTTAAIKDLFALLTDICGDVINQYLQSIDTEACTVSDVGTFSLKNRDNEELLAMVIIRVVGVSVYTLSIDTPSANGGCSVTPLTSNRVLKAIRAVRRSATIEGKLG